MMQGRTTTGTAALAVAAAICGLAVAVGGTGAAVAILIAVAAMFAMLRGGLQALILTYIATRPMVDTMIRADVFGFSPGQLWAAGLLLLTGVWALSLKDHRARDWWPLGAFAVAYLLLVVLRGDLAVGLGRGVRILAWGLLLPVVATAVRQGLDRRWVLRSGYAFALLAGVAATYSVLTGRYGETYYTVGSNLTQEYQAPHALVTMLVLGAPFVVHALLSSRGSVRWVHSLVLAGLAALAVLSMVRSGILAMGVLLFAVALHVAGRGSTRQRISVAVGGSSVLLVWLWLQDQAIARLGALLPSSTSGAAIGSGRSVFWLALIREVTASPASVAVGMGGGADRAIITVATGMRIGAHSDPLELLAVGGLVLLATYGWFLYAPFKRAVSLARYEHAGDARDVGVVFVAAAAGFLVLATTNGAMGYQGSVAFGLLGGLALGLPGRGPGRESGVEV